MLDLVAPIYRQLIYEFCDIYTLNQVGMTCKKINQEESRIQVLIQKIPELLTLQRLYTVGLNMQVDVSQKINFAKLPVVLLKPVTENYTEQTTSIQIDFYKFPMTKDQILYFNLKLFTLLTNSQKHKHVDFYFRLFQSIANQEYKIFRKWMGFYHISICDLHEMFLVSDNEIRDKIIEEILHFKNHPKDFSILIENFIPDIIGSNINHLDEIIQVAFYLKQKYPQYLTLFLDSSLGNYLDLSYDDHHMYSQEAYDKMSENLEKMLDQPSKLFPHKTNEQVLEELLLECKLFSTALIRITIRQRIKRLKEESEETVQNKNNL